MKVICPNCGRPSATARALPTYRYRESGLPNIRLRGGVTETTCAICGKRNIRIEKEAQLLQVLAMGLLMKPGFLTGPEMRFLRGSCEMSQAVLASAIKHRRETVSERETKRNPGLTLAEEIWLRLVLLASFRGRLKTEGNNFLTVSHLQKVDKFVDEFCAEALKFAEQTLRRIQLTAAMDENGELWQLDEAA